HLQHDQETSKFAIGAPSPASGVLPEIVLKSGQTVAVGALPGAIVEGEGKANPAKSKQAAKAPALVDLAAAEAGPIADEPALRNSTPDLGQAKPASVEAKSLEREPMRREEISVDDMPPSPSARKLLAEKKPRPSEG